MILQHIQSKLAFEDWLRYPQFSTKMGLGRVAMLACILGTLWGIHFTLILFICFCRLGIFQQSLFEPDRMQLVLQWSCYVLFLSTFHLLEFFITALYNPYVTSADSFLINHSIAYTTAALLSWTEFWVHFWCFPPFSTIYMMLLGVVMAIVAQCIRTLAMATCAESFNHLIQVTKKDNHVLVTNGIYKIFRHPSYVGFYYWAVGTQLLLGNIICTVLFAIAAWMFFKRRIPYEEEALLQLFPEEYPDYVKSTYVGIPFLKTKS